MTDIQDAQKLIADAQQQADHACLQDLHQVLNKHGRRLIVTNIGLHPGGWLEPQIIIVPIQPQDPPIPPPSFPSPAPHLPPAPEPTE